MCVNLFPAGEFGGFHICVREKLAVRCVESYEDAIFLPGREEVKQSGPVSNFWTPWGMIFAKNMIGISAPIWYQKSGVWLMD